MIMNNLVAHEIPLQGKHLIEASAGTGKTFNITRIYLRLLLEKKMPVEQILVMTFTKDATEELRGRIDAFIRLALNDWEQLIVEDEYFQAISQHVDASEAKILLQQALLFLDEAAIFTIHGFCKRVLTQHAFASGLPFNLQMESACQDIIVQACQDWYRVLAHENSEQFLCLAQFWPQPISFINQFSKAINQQCELDVVKESDIKSAFVQIIEQAISALVANKLTLESLLIDVKKGQDREVRQQEYQALVQWLTLLKDDLTLANSKMPDAFIDGRRFARAACKEELVEIFTPVNKVKQLVKDIDKNIKKARAFAIVREGIHSIRERFTQQKQHLNLLSFDDLISTLASALIQEQEQTKEGGNQLAQQLFKQYPVALVDEFQDTDPQQFTILKAIYYHKSSCALYMIGDPKQAIYGFRGGDVFAYLSARSGCDYLWLMDTNWRSSAEMITGYNRLFYGNSLKEQAAKVFGYDIPYLPVKASVNSINKTFNDKCFNALQFIHFNDDAIVAFEQTQSAANKAPSKSKPKSKSTVVKQNFRPVMAKWCANEISRLLVDESLALSAQDIAILVRDGAEAADIKQALEECQLASVYMSNRANLLQSEQSNQLIKILKGILFVENEQYFSSALTVSLFGINGDKFYKLQQDPLLWQELKFNFESLRQLWRQKGFISMALKLMHDHFAIAAKNKDRVLTNLLHLFELLQAASQRHHQPQELLYWFEQQCQLDNPEIETELRLESDDNLIRIITQHGAKGLEYPVVFIPFATRHKNPLKFGNTNVSFIEYHDENGQLKLSLDGSDEAKQAMADENYAESIRLLYVAITRAEQRCYLLTTAFDQYHLSPLGKTLKWQPEQDIQQSLIQLTSDEPASIAMGLVDGVIDNTLHHQAKPNNVTASLAVFSGKIERDWWLSSFSALSRNLKDVGISAPDRDEDKIINSTIGVDNTDNIESPIANLLRFDIAKGAHTGNLLHDILQHTNFTDPDWAQVIKWPLVKYGELTKGYDEKDLQQWLTQILQCQLPFTHGNNVSNADSCANSDREESFSLSDIPLNETLRESEFYFPMQSASTSQLTNMLTDHRKAKLTPPQQVNAVHLPAYNKLKGMMHGFIDLIFTYQGKYYVCDYKSSYLGEHYNDYNNNNMRENIESNYYDLQYLIYSLALHRHLKFSLKDYNVEEHFGGVFYLYLRGMSEQKQYQDAGVYFQKITATEIQRLDDIFLGVNNHVS